MCVGVFCVLVCDGDVGVFIEFVCVVLVKDNVVKTHVGFHGVFKLIQIDIFVVQYIVYVEVI